MLALERLNQLLDMRPRHPGMKKIKVYHPIQTPTGQAQSVAKRQKASMQVFSYRRRPDRYAQHIFQMRVDTQVISAVIVVQGMATVHPARYPCAWNSRGMAWALPPRKVRTRERASSRAPSPRVRRPRNGGASGRFSCW